MKKIVNTLILFLICLTIITPNAVFVGGIKDQKEAAANPLTRTLVSTEPSVKPEWVDVVSEVGTVACYTEKYFNDKNKEEYIVYTFHKINRQKAEEEISSFAKNISERYTASFSQWKTLRVAIAKNTSSNFSFSVTQLNILLDTPEKLEAGLKKAVDALAVNIPTRTETVIGRFTMTGTEIPSELSVFLTEKTVCCSQFVD